MNDLFGFTRNVVKELYALFTPSGFVPSQLPGWSNAVCVVQISPALGAQFSQTLITLAKNGQGRGHSRTNEYFVYVLEGNCMAKIDNNQRSLAAGSYVYLPPDRDFQFDATAEGARLLVFEKVYQTLRGVGIPEPLVKQEGQVAGLPFLGNADATLQTLLPDTAHFDMAVNIFTYQPGATLPFVETHIMEHGLAMLSGQGIYRLGADYYPVQAGDVIWMAPYCPQWFVAMGKTPARYIYYKDVNRAPMTQ
ncbi:MAG: (S)-ureidoglycine aminohydrolase [Verrucomicrobiota bacterium]|nr:(S)-ureidoglycine aminohydrolase [Verrucomicrobiota bacterium]